MEALATYPSAHCFLKTIYRIGVQFMRLNRRVWTRTARFPKVLKHWHLKRKMPWKDSWRRERKSPTRLKTRPWSRTGLPRWQAISTTWTIGLCSRNCPTNQCHPRQLWSPSWGRLQSMWIVSMGKLKLPKVGLKPVRTEALHLARLLSDHAHASSSWGNFDGGLFYFGLAHIPKRTLNTLWFEAVLHIFAGSEFKLFSMCPLQVIVWSGFPSPSRAFSKNIISKERQGAEGSLMDRKLATYESWKKNL